MWSLATGSINSLNKSSVGVTLKELNPKIGLNITSITDNVTNTSSVTKLLDINNNYNDFNIYSINSEAYPHVLVVDNITYTENLGINPQDRTFTYNTITKTVTLYTRTTNREVTYLKSSLPIKIYTKTVPNIVTDYLDYSILPKVLKGIPLRGSIQISLGFEQHPNASLELITDYRYIDLFRKAFIGGTEIELFDIGFRVNSINIRTEPRSNSPNMEYIVSISLGGKWENYVDKEVNLKNVRPNQLGNSYLNGNKPEETCLNKPNTSTVGRPTTRIPISILSNSIGASVCGLAAFIEIDNSTPLDTWINWFNVFQEHLRVNSSYMILSNPNCIEAKHINSVKSSTVEDSILLNYDGTSINSRLKRNYPQFKNIPEPLSLDSSLPSKPLDEPVIPNKKEDLNLIPYGSEYINTKLDGRFNNPLPNNDNEETQGNSFKEQKPSWRRKPPERLVTKQGDLNPEIPPPYTAGICEGYDLSLNWDSSGPTKVLRISTTENGSPISEEVYTYGFVYTAAQIAGLDKNGEPIPKKPLTIAWQLVQQEITEHFYDPKTGYYLGCETNGWSIRRFRQENTTEPETVLYGYELLRIKKELEDKVKYSRNEEDGSIISTPLTEAEIEEWGIEGKYYQAIIESCLPRQVKSLSKTMYSLEPFHKYYKDTNLGGYETYQICLPNGKLGYGLVEDPSWIPPHFVAYEYREVNSFDNMPNPENIIRKWEFDKTINQRLPSEPQEYKPLPPLTVGEESHYVQQTVVYPKDYKIKEDWELSNLSNKETRTDRYTKYTNEYSGQDSQFYASLHNTKFEEFVGRPGEASKKDLGWEKVEPKQTEENPPDLNNGLTSTVSNASIPLVPIGISNCELLNTTTSSIPIQYPGGYIHTPNSLISSHKLNNSYDYYMSTPGVDIYKESPQGSQSYNYAYTLLQAINAAQTDLYINNVQNTLSTSFSIPLNLNIKEFDKIVLIINGETMLRRVLSVSHNIEIQGQLNNKPFTTGTTTITCGLDRCVGFGIYRRIRPESLNDNSNSTKENNNPQTLYRFIILDNKPIEMGDLIKIDIARRTSFDF